MSRDAMPHGFRRSVGTGLIVPEEHSRQREVWSKDDLRLLDRATKMLASYGMEIFLGCKEPACKAAGPIERHRRNDGGITLRCAHKDREVHDL